jgi:hypothetical protein
METLYVNKRVLGAVALLAFLAASSVNAQGVKWHPGHYVTLAGGESPSTHLKRIDEIGKESSIQGVLIRVNWAELEKSTGVYDLSVIDSYLRRLKAQPTPKRLVLRIMDRRFGTGSSGIVPTYLTSQDVYNGGLVKTSQGYVARIWEKPVMDRLIALYKVVGARYNGDSYFEGMQTGETTLSLKTPFPSGYTHAKLEAQWERLAVAAKASMPSTNVFVMTNWIGSTSLMEQLIQSLMSPSAGVGSANTTPGDPNLGQKVWTGVTGADYRGRLAIAAGVETSELGGRNGDFTPKQIGDYAYNTLRANHVFWAYNTWMGDSTQRWKTGILPYLRKNPPTRTTCPSTYGSCKT